MKTRSPKNVKKATRRKAIRKACDENACVAISFPSDIENWIEIIERHLDDSNKEPG